MDAIKPNNSAKHNSAKLHNGISPTLSLHDPKICSGGSANLLEQIYGGCCKRVARLHCAAKSPCFSKLVSWIASCEFVLFTQTEGTL